MVAQLLSAAARCWAAAMPASGGTGHGKLACRDEFEELGVEFGLRELAPAGDPGVEPHTNGAIDPWQGRPETRLEHAMDPTEAKDHEPLALFDDAYGCGRERGQGREQDDRENHVALIGPLRTRLERQWPPPNGLGAQLRATALTGTDPAQSMPPRGNQGQFT